MSDTSPDIHIGDTVRRGHGQAAWVVRGLWTASTGQRMADLMPITARTSASAALENLTVIDRPIDTQEPPC